MCRAEGERTSWSGAKRSCGTTAPDDSYAANGLACSPSADEPFSDQVVVPAEGSGADRTITFPELQPATRLADTAASR
jgi:hypothetical protein